MPGIRRYQPVDDPEEMDEALTWVGVLALFSEMSVAQRALFIRHMGTELYQLRNDDMRHLQSRERVLGAVVLRRKQEALTDA